MRLGYISVGLSPNDSRQIVSKTFVNTRPVIAGWAVIRPEQHPPSNLILRRLLHVVDHHDVRVRLGALQLQAQLLL
jgi:hypothetical protein